MTYPDPYSQQPVPSSPPGYYPPPPPTDSSKKFLNMSGGVLILTIAGVILVCCIGPIALCVFGGALSAITDASKPDPAVQVVSCLVDDPTRVASVRYVIKSNSGSKDSYEVRFEVLDAAGAQVGEGSDVVTVEGGATVMSEVSVAVRSSGGENCRFVSVD